MKHLKSLMQASCVDQTLAAWLNLSQRSLTFSTEVINTELPMRTNIMRPVKRCSLMPKNLGCSPGAEHSDSSFRLFTWEIDSTVAATNHGRPIKEQTPSITPTTNRSRWYPQPFCGDTQTQQRTSSLQKYLLTKWSIVKDLATHLQLVFLPVNNNGSDLLVHEDEDGAQQSWD